MSDEKRRTSILEADELIRRLGDELSAQSRRAAAVDQARRELEDAIALLERAHAALQETSTASAAAVGSLQDRVVQAGVQQDEWLRTGLAAIEARLSALHVAVLDDSRKAREALERFGHDLAGEARRRFDDGTHAVREASTALDESMGLLQEFHSTAHKASEAISREAVGQALAELKDCAAQFNAVREQLDARLVPTLDRSSEAALAYERRAEEIQRSLDIERQIVESLRSIETRIGRGIQLSHQRLVKQLAEGQRTLRTQLWIVGAIATIGVVVSMWLLLTGARHQ